MRAKTVETLTDQAFTGAPTAIDAQQCLVKFHDSPQKSLHASYVKSSAASCRPNTINQQAPTAVSLHSPPKIEQASTSILLAKY